MSVAGPAGSRVDGPRAHLVDASVALPRTRVPGRRGAIATGQHDEDVVTLGAEAASAVLDRTGATPRALVLATTTSPLAEGGVAQVLVEALDLVGADLLVTEVGGTTAAGGGALATAVTLVAAGRGPVLVVAADTRRDHGGRATGDAAVALLLGTDGDGASLTHVSSSAELVRDAWRLDGHTGTERADRSFAKVVTRPPAPRPDVPQPVAVTAAGPAVDRVGDAGCAAFPLALLLALDAGDGDAVVVASGVTHRFAMTAGTRAAELAGRARAAVAGGVDEPAPRPAAVEGFDPYASQPRSWRDRAQDLRLVGQRDPETGEVLFPPVPAAGAGPVEPHRLARAGRVLTFTRDHVFPQGAPLSMAVVELDGGGRFYGQVVDGREVAIGDPVELVLRRLHDGGGLPQWFWKVRPTGSAAEVADVATA